MTNENELHPRQLVIPNVSEAIRDLMVCERGTIILNTDTGVLNYCDVANTANATSWGLVTTT